MTMKRREFLARAAAGSAVLTMPGFLAGCGVQPATSIAEPPPANPFLDWFGVDEPTVARVMAALTVNGADIADLYFQHTRDSQILLEQGVVSEAESRIQQGLGLRVVVGEQTGYAYTEDLALPSMLTTARIAAAIASGTQTVVPRSFAHREAGNLYATTVPWSDVGLEQKLPILQSVEQKARALEPAVERVSVHWADSDERILIATLEGDLITDHRPMTRLTVIVTARRGDEVQSGYAHIAAREELVWYTDERLTSMVEEAVANTMILFETQRAPVGDMPVILASGASGILLHEAIGHGMEADFNRDGTSIYSDMMGQKVAAELVTVVDRADMPGERGALNIDDEGVAPGHTVLVDNGILVSYLHDRLSASQYGVGSTGSGRRQSYRFSPMPRMTCTYMEDGPHEKGEIIEAVDRGILCETYENGRVELGAGDYAFDVKNAWLVERGRVTAPLKDVTISGNGPELLQRITMVADDGRMDSGGWTCGKYGQNVPVSQGIPTVLVSTMTVGSRSTG